MPQAPSSEPSLLLTERPRCPECRGLMMLTGIECGPTHSDLLMFECPKCNNVHKLPVGDPMRSGNPGDALCIPRRPTLFHGPSVSGVSVECGSHDMPEPPSFGALLSSIQRPRCPSCQIRMMPVRIVEGSSGCDIRSFECAKCDPVQSTLVVNDPMKSGSAQGWLAAELGTPE